MRSTCCAPARTGCWRCSPGGLVLSPPKSMLDNSPLRELLGVHVDCDGIRRSIARGHLQAFALCATSYTTGQSVAFYDAVDSVA